jgi:hypothetical protein
LWNGCGKPRADVDDPPARVILLVQRMISPGGPKVVAPFRSASFPHIDAADAGAGEGGKVDPSRAIARDKLGNVVII